MQATNPKEIYLDLLRQIANKKITPGSKLPSERNLAEKYQTNRMNTHYALDLLAREDIIVRQHRAGTFVNEKVSFDRVNRLLNRTSSKVLIIESESRYSFIHWNNTTITTLVGLLEKNFDVSYGKLPDNLIELADLITELNTNEIKAIVIFPGSEESIKLLHDNVQLLDDYPGEIFLYDREWLFQNPTGCNLVSINYEHEGRMAAKYLLDKGYRNIAFYYQHDARYPLPHWHEARQRGAKQILGDKLRIFAIDELNCDYSGIIDFIRNNEKPGIIGRTDENAAELIGTANKAGLTAGKNFGLISADNNPRYRYLNLTTIAPPLEIIGSLLADIITDRIKHHDENVNIKYLVKSKIVEGHTA